VTDAITITDVSNFPPILTVAQAANILQVSQNTVYELCQQGRVPRVRFGRTIRIPRDALLRWVEEEAARAQAEQQTLIEISNRLRPPWKRLKTS